MFLRPKKLPVKLLNILCFSLCLSFFFSVNAQTKKSTTKNQAAKKTEERKSDKSTSKTDTSIAKQIATKTNKPTKAELDKKAEQKRLEAERQVAIRKAEEEKRKAMLAEQRRREQAAREARERQLAFERGLKTETRENISNDETEGEDLEVRRAAINALGNHAGTVVVMEPQTGKILSIVNQEWAIRRGHKPCSTIKLVTGVAGVNEKLIDQQGNVRNGNHQLDLDDALAHSNNTYFQQVGANMGNSRLISYAQALGLGQTTGINAENENAGKLPYGNNNPRIYSHGDDFEVTPLQLAVMVSAMSNGGKLVVPQIPKTKFEKANFQGFMRKEVEIPQQSVQRVLPGMIGAVNYGTAKRALDYSLNIAGKTGSCIGQGSWLGLFASVAPVINPKLSVVVITRGNDERGKNASEIAGKIYKALTNRFNNERLDLTSQVPLQLKPQQRITAKTSHQIDNNEGEDSNEGDSPRVHPKNNSATAKTTATKPVFEPVIIVVNREKTRPRVVQTNPERK